MKSTESKETQGVTPLGLSAVVDLTQGVFARASGILLTAAALAACMGFLARAIFGLSLDPAEQGFRVLVAAASVLGGASCLRQTVTSAGARRSALGLGPPALPGVAVAIAGTAVGTAVLFGLAAGAESAVEAVLTGWLMVFAGWLFVQGLAQAVATLGGRAAKANSGSGS